MQISTQLLEKFSKDKKIVFCLDEESIKSITTLNHSDFSALLGLIDKIPFSILCHASACSALFYNPSETIQKVIAKILDKLSIPENKSKFVFILFSQNEITPIYEAVAMLKEKRYDIPVCLEFLPITDRSSVIDRQKILLEQQIHQHIKKKHGPTDLPNFVIEDLFSSEVLFDYDVLIMLAKNYQTLSVYIDHAAYKLALLSEQKYTILQARAEFIQGSSSDSENGLIFLSDYRLTAPELVEVAKLCPVFSTRLDIQAGKLTLLSEQKYTILQARAEFIQGSSSDSENGLIFLSDYRLTAPELVEVAKLCPVFSIQLDNEAYKLTLSSEQKYTILQARAEFIHNTHDYCAVVCYKLTFDDLTFVSKCDINCPTWLEFFIDALRNLPSSAHNRKIDFLKMLFSYRPEWFDYPAHQKEQSSLIPLSVKDSPSLEWKISPKYSDIEFVAFVLKIYNVKAIQNIKLSVEEEWPSSSANDETELPSILEGFRKNLSVFDDIFILEMHENLKSFAFEIKGLERYNVALIDELVLFLSHFINRLTQSVKKLETLSITGFNSEKFELLKKLTGSFPSVDILEIDFVDDTLKGKLTDTKLNALEIAQNDSTSSLHNVFTSANSCFQYLNYLKLSNINFSSINELKLQPLQVNTHVFQLAIYNSKIYNGEKSTSFFKNLNCLLPNVTQLMFHKCQIDLGSNFLINLQKIKTLFLNASSFQYNGSDFKLSNLKEFNRLLSLFLKDTHIEELLLLLKIPGGSFDKKDMAEQLVQALETTEIHTLKIKIDFKNSNENDDADDDDIYYFAIPTNRKKRYFSLFHLLPHEVQQIISLGTYHDGRPIFSAEYAFCAYWLPFASEEAFTATADENAIKRLILNIRQSQCKPDIIDLLTELKKFAPKIGPQLAPRLIHIFSWHAIFGPGHINPPIDTMHTLRSSCTQIMGNISNIKFVSSRESEKSMISYVTTASHASKNKELFFNKDLSVEVATPLLYPCLRYNEDTPVFGIAPLTVVHDPISWNALNLLNMPNGSVVIFDTSYFDHDSIVAVRTNDLSLNIQDTLFYVKINKSRSTMLITPSERFEQVPLEKVYMSNIYMWKRFFVPITIGLALSNLRDLPIFIIPKVSDNFNYKQHLELKITQLKSHVRREIQLIVNSCKKCIKTIGEEQHITAHKELFTTTQHLSIDPSSDVAVRSITPQSLSSRLETSAESLPGLSVEQKSTIKDLEIFITILEEISKYAACNIHMLASSVSLDKVIEENGGKTMVLAEGLGTASKCLHYGAIFLHMHPLHPNHEIYDGVISTFLQNHRKTGKKSYLDAATFMRSIIKNVGDFEKFTRDKNFKDAFSIIRELGDMLKFSPTIEENTSNNLTTLSYAFWEFRNQLAHDDGHPVSAVLDKLFPPSCSPSL